MGRKRIRIVAVVLFGALFGLFTVWIHHEVKVEMATWTGAEGGGSVQHSGNLEVGEEIPDFAAVDLAGESVTLSEFREREAVVLDFWATWCQPCVRSMPELQELSNDYAGHEVAFLAVNLGEEPEQVREFLEEKDFRFGVRVVMDENEKIGSEYGVDSIPQLVIVGRDGRVKHIELGYPPMPDGAARRDQRLRDLLDDLARPAPRSAFPGA